MKITQLEKSLDTVWKLFEDDNVYLLHVNWHVSTTGANIPAFRLKSLKNTSLLVTWYITAIGAMGRSLALMVTRR